MKKKNLKKKKKLSEQNHGGCNVVILYELIQVITCGPHRGP